MTTLYFATDVHGSNICWNKFINAGKFYKADVIILGGDMTGKAIVPIVHKGNNTYRVVLLEHESILHGEDEVNEMTRRIKSRGYYPYRTTIDEMDELQDIDMVCEKTAGRSLEKFLTEMEYIPDRTFNTLNHDSRYLYQNKDNQRLLVLLIDYPLGVSSFETICQDIIEG